MMVEPDRTPQIRVRWLEEYRTEIDIRGTHQLRTDETPEYGGDDTGPMPTELFLASVASCMCQATYHVAHKQRLPMTRLEVRVVAEKETGPFRFEDVYLEIQADLPSGRLQRLVERARNYCFVSNTITRGCSLHIETASTSEEV